MDNKFDKVKPIYYESISDYRKELLETNSTFDGCFSLQDYEDIEKWDLNCKLFETSQTLPPGYSIGFQYVYLNKEDVVIGMVNFRPYALEHPYLSKFGGHIGYNVRPSCRGEGIGNNMLKDFLKICKEDYLLDKVLITCLENNDASRKIILYNNGIFESKIDCPQEKSILERYWIYL